MSCDICDGLAMRRLQEARLPSMCAECLEAVAEAEEHAAQSAHNNGADQ